MGLMIIGHILGDFYVQANNVAEKKKKSVGYMLLHCLIYMVGMYILTVLLTGDFVLGLQAIIIIGLSHLCIDSMKVQIESKYMKSKKYECIIFLVDQIIHMVIILVVCYFLDIHLEVNRYSFIQKNNIIHIRKAIAITIAALICWRPTAIFVSLVFKMIPITIEEADTVEEESDKKKERNENTGTNEKAENYENEVIKIGSWIGILEREIILLLGLLGQYGAIGFVLAAKSLARYKQLENKSFAEKYLVGTLLSAMVAILCVAICSLIK